MPTIPLPYLICLTDISRMTADYISWRQRIEYDDLYRFDTGLDPQVPDVQFDEPITELHTFTGHEVLGARENERIFVSDSIPQRRRLATRVITYKQLFDIICDPGYSHNNCEPFIRVCGYKVFFGYYPKGSSVPEAWYSYISSECAHVEIGA